jgi:hypothetical protein
MIRAQIVISGVVATLLIVAAASAASPSAANPTDKQLANRLVAARGDVPSGMADTGGGLQPGRCLPRTGFTITAKATAPHWGTPHSFIDSAATVLKTRAEAKTYYRATVRAMSACLAAQWRRDMTPASIGHARALRFPRHGDQSAAQRMTLDFPPQSDPFATKYTFDWVVVRKRRAVLVDDFLFWVGWGNGGPLTVAGAERRSVSRELTRAFGS